MWIVLNMRPNDSLLVLATVCSSWSSINVGTSKRSILLPEGDTSLAYVARANSGALVLVNTVDGKNPAKIRVSPKHFFG